MERELGVTQSTRLTQTDGMVRPPVHGTLVLVQDGPRNKLGK